MPRGLQGIAQSQFTALWRLTSINFLWTFSCKNKIVTAYMEMTRTSLLIRKPMYVELHSRFITEQIAFF